MSDPTEPTPASPVPAAPLEAAPAASGVHDAPVALDPAVAVAGPQAGPDARVPEPPLPSGAPYRTQAPPPPLDALVAEMHFGPPPRRPRPLIGPALSVFAVMLWTFVVAGQFASSWTLGIQLRNGEATILVVLATLVAWFTSMRRSRNVVPPRSTFHLIWRAIGAGVVALLLFVLCIVAATAINSGMNVDFLVAAVLALVSLLAAITGPHLTSPIRADRTPRQRILLVMLWIAGTLLTLVAGADLGANG